MPGKAEGCLNRPVQPSPQGGFQRIRTCRRAPWACRAAALCFLAATGFAQPPVIRVNVNLVRVVATVRNQAGTLVSALQKDDFEVYDNGVRQDLAVFERQTDQPVSVALMIDISGSTGKDLKYETDSASRFLHSLLGGDSGRDAVALFGFNADVQEIAGFTHDYTSLEARFRYLAPAGATALFDAILLGSRELERRRGPQGDGDRHRRRRHVLQDQFA